jgi:hypothetical protein
MDFAKQKLPDWASGERLVGFSSLPFCVLRSGFQLGCNSSRHERYTGWAYERLLLGVTAGGEKFETSPLAVAKRDEVRNSLTEKRKFIGTVASDGRGSDPLHPATVTKIRCESDTPLGKSYRSQLRRSWAARGAGRSSSHHASMRRRRGEVKETDGYQWTAS